MELAVAQTYMHTSDMLAEIVEFRGWESGGHINRIRQITRILLTCAVSTGEVSFTSEQIEKICAASALHDIGKIAVSEKILLKPGRLSTVEYSLMQSHSMRGWEILNRMSGKEDEQYHQYCCDICRYHHERWDGKGYPDHLKGDEIPFWAQVVALADVYDALASKRVYKQAYSHEKAVEMIVGGDCGVFSPFLTGCFVAAGEQLCKELWPPQE